MVQCNYHQKYLPTPGVAKLGIEDLLLKCSCLSILFACLSKIEEKNWFSWMWRTFPLFKGHLKRTKSSVVLSSREGLVEKKLASLTCSNKIKPLTASTSFSKALCSSTISLAWSCALPKGTLTSSSCGKKSKTIRLFENDLRLLF